ncbi:HtaA domain-containing protein [Microbacterium gilvum]|uniref:Htaa domain-containing protein n=1 Tax=Microbacterium gilvum TaxID=1336204 RepID=A0ABP9A1F8_9MICO
MAIRRRPRRLLAALVVPLLALGAVVGVSNLASAQGGAFLDWGVKASFRTYITGTAHGSATLEGGVTQNADGTYRWPSSNASYDASSGEVVVATTGAVHFTGHDGVLDLRIADIEARIAADGSATLRADVTSNKTTGETVDYGRVDLATLDATRGDRVVGAGTLDWNGIPTTLTATGAAAFGGFYGAGAVLDPVSLSLTGDWEADGEGEDWAEPGTASLMPAGEVEGGVKPVHVVADEARGTVTIIATGYSPSVYSQCRAHNVGVYADCIAATTRIPHPDQGEVTATIVEAATGDVRAQFDLTEGRTASVGANPAYMLYTAALDTATGEVFAHIANHGLVVIPPTADGAVQVLTGMSASPSYATVDVDPSGGRLFFLDAAKGLFTFTRVDGAWTQEHLLSELTGVGARYLSVDRSTGEAWIYDAGSTAGTRELYPVTGLRAGVPVVHRDRAVTLTTTAADTDRAAGIVRDAETGTVHAIVNESLTAGGSWIATVEGGAVVAHTPLPAYATALSIDGAGRVYVVNSASKLVQAFDGRDRADGVLPLRAELVVGEGVGVPTSVAAVGDRVFITVPSPAGTSYPTAVTNANLLTVEQYLAQKTYRTAYVYDWQAAPTFASQPMSQTAVLTATDYLDDGSPGPAEPAAVVFSAEVEGADALQWQTSTASGWRDVADDGTHAGATTSRLTVQAGEALAGAGYRLIARSDAGDVVSDAVELSVEVVAAPRVTAHPQPQAVAAGATAVFSVSSLGAPEPAVTWQRAEGGGWVDIVDSDVYAVDGATLRVTGGADGALFRARLVNVAGEALTEPAALTVGAPSAGEVVVTLPDGATPGGSFSWSWSPGQGAHLGTATQEGDSFTASGSLNTVVVDDTRTTAAGWTVSASVSDFESGAASFAADALSWTPTAVSESAAVVAGPAASGLAEPRTLAVSTGPASAELGAALALRIDADVPAGDYRALVTVTAVS